MQRPEAESGAPWIQAVWRSLPMAGATMPAIEEDGCCRKAVAGRRSRKHSHPFSAVWRA